MQLVIVKRDEFATFELLCRVFADDPDVRVVWDRRVGQRRRAAVQTSEERRSSDRRRLVKDWANLNYFVVRSAA